MIHFHYLSLIVQITRKTDNSLILKYTFTPSFRVSPIGICSLIAAKVAAMADIADSLNMVGLYMATVIAGLLIHALIIIPVLYLITARKNPVRYYIGLRDAIITAFGTSSRYVYRVQNSSRHFVHSCQRLFTQEIEKKCHPIP